jgi:hypothetical protein
VIAAAGTHATIEELWEAVLSVRFVPRIYNERSLETAVKRVGG